ncbi:MAG: VOC family protein [Pseudomonadota bacterium]
MTLTLDHLVFGTADLAHGIRWMRAALGVPPAAEGRHPQMGTINALWRIGSAYLEVIAIDRAAPPPPHPRWFALDTDQITDRIERTPRLVTWVVATDDMEAARRQSPRDPGPARRFYRDRLHWHLTVPADGSIHHDGAFPSLIQWPQGVSTPQATLPYSGLSLAEFRIAGAPELHNDLKALGADHLITGFEPASETGFLVRIESPETGSVHLS